MLKGFAKILDLAGRNHSSPNAGFPEASFAGEMGVKLGGPNGVCESYVKIPVKG